MSDSVQKEATLSGSLFRSLAMLALVGHSLILAATAAAGIWQLVIINVISVSLYAVALIMNAHAWYLAVLGIGVIEVSVHAVVATSLLGWGSGFHIYLLALVPLVFFFDLWSLRTRALASGGIIVFYVVFAWYAQRAFFDDPRWFVEWFRYGNLAVGAVVIAALSYYYGTAVRQAQIDLEKKNAQLDELARTDPLTCLANRREALHLIEIERVRSIRASDVFAIALIDIDYFKNVNDQYGHDAGDAVLKQVALLLHDSLRAQDAIARWGGEEFLLLLPQTGQEGALVVAEKARGTIERHEFVHAGMVLRITVTIGVEVFHHDSDLESVLQRADRSLYRGKDEGRNCVCHAW